MREILFFKIRALRVFLALERGHLASGRKLGITNWNASGLRLPKDDSERRY